MLYYGSVYTYKRELNEGDVVYTVGDVSNNGLKVPELTLGRIVGLSTQEEADIYVKEYDIEDTLGAINLNNSGDEKNSYKGVVLRLDGKNFGVLFSYTKHRNLILDIDKVKNIPYVNEGELALKLKKNNGINYVSIIDVVENIELNFSKWVEEQLKVENIIKLSEGTHLDEKVGYEQKEELINYLYKEEQYKLETDFIKATGLYHHFVVSNE